MLHSAHFDTFAALSAVFEYFRVLSLAQSLLENVMDHFSTNLDVIGKPRACRRN